MNITTRRKEVQRSVINRQENPISSQFSYKMANIVIVGDKEIRRKILSIEKKFNVMLIFTEPDMLEELINSKTISVIVDEKKVEPKEKKYLEVLLANYKFLPIFYLSRTIKTSNFYSSLYAKGLQGVINWPSEAKVLHDLIIESIRPHPKATGKSKGDKKLSEMVKSHLILNGNYKSIKVKVIEGFVFLEGRVKSLFDKKIIESESSKVLGVKKVIAKNIKIRDSKKTTDNELERKIKMYMANILGEKKRSMSVKVKSKIVTLMGVTSSHEDILDIEQFSMKQPGVQDVIRLVKYHPSLVSKNVKKAKFLEIKIKEIFEGVKYISINIFGEYAEVSGTVKVLGVRMLVEKYLLQTLPIKRVVNKLFVAGSPPL